VRWVLSCRKSNKDSSTDFSGSQLPAEDYLRRKNRFGVRIFELGHSGMDGVRVHRFTLFDWVQSDYLRPTRQSVGWIGRYPAFPSLPACYKYENNDLAWSSPNGTIDISCFTLDHHFDPFEKHHGLQMIHPWLQRLSTCFYQFIGIDHL